MPFISFYDYITSREITQEKNEKIDKKIKHFECLHQFFYFKSVKLPGISRSYVSRIETKAIGKLAREFKE